MGLRPVAATLAVLLAGVILWWLGASVRMLAMVAGAMGLGALLGLLPWRRWLTHRPSLALALAGLLLGVALAGTSLDGVTRWIRVGPVSLQPAFILLPLILLAPPTPLRFAAVALAAISLALQPDAGMLVGLVAALAAQSAVQRTRLSLLETLAAALALAAAALVPAAIAPVPLVEGMWQAVTGPALILLPLALLAAASATLALWSPKEPQWAALWGGLSLASLVGAYPTPLLGASVSAAIGLALSMVLASRHR